MLNVPRSSDLTLVIGVEGRSAGSVRCCCEMELKVPSDMIYLRPVRAFVRELAEGLGFCHEKANDIELAVDEIFTNAIEHGSDDTGSSVMVQCLSTDEMMKIIISDTGYRATE